VSPSQTGDLLPTGGDGAYKLGDIMQTPVPGPVRLTPACVSLSNQSLPSPPCPSLSSTCTSNRPPEDAAAFILSLDGILIFVSFTIENWLRLFVFSVSPSYQLRRILCSCHSTYCDSSRYFQLPRLHPPDCAPVQEYYTRSPLYESTSCQRTLDAHKGPSTVRDLH
jgi:hypothetical protein